MTASRREIKGVPHVWSILDNVWIPESEWDATEGARLTAGRSTAGPGQEEPVTDPAGDLARFVDASRELKPRRIVYVDATMHELDGFVPAVVIEDEAGFYPLKGSGSFAQPWYWGHDLAEAKLIADRANEQMGHTPEDVREILASSMRAMPQPPADQPGGRGRLA